MVRHLRCEARGAPLLDLRAVTGAATGAHVRRRRPAIATVVAGLIVVGFVAVCTVDISRPGVEYDEALFLNAATGAHGGDAFIYRRLFGHPLLLMSYIGALKAYLFYPIFRVFGVSALTIRLPVILLTAAALVGTYLLARRLFGGRVAAVLLLVVASEPALIFTTRTDWGPVVLMTFFKVMALNGLFLFLRDGRVRWLLLLYGSLLAGIYDKLNFLWFVAALLVATPLALWPELRERSRELRSRGVLSSNVVFAGLAALMVAAFLPAALHDVNGGPLDLRQRFADVRQLFTTTFDGSVVYGWMTARNLAFTAWTPWLVLPAAVGGLVAAVARVVPARVRNPEARRDLRIALFFALLFAVTFAEMVATRSATGPHHVMTLWAFTAFSIAAALRAAWRALPPHAVRPRWAVAAIVAAATVAVTASQVAVDAEFVAAFHGNNSFNAPWSPAIYPLSDLLEGRIAGADEVVTVDWGMGNQLYGFASAADRPKYHDLWVLFQLLDPASPDAPAVRQAFFAGRRVLVVLHAPGNVTFPQARAHFMAFAAESGIALGRPQVVRDPAGLPVFLVYDLDVAS